MKLFVPALLLSGAAAAFGQSSRAVELFGTFGAMRGGGDESSAGSGAAYGGAVTIPISSRWGVDVQLLTSRLSDRPDFRLRRILVSPGLLYRRGDDRARWFIAFGPGSQRDLSSGTYQAFDSTGGSRTIAFEDSQNGPTLHWRTGAVFQPASRVLIRGEFFWVTRYVLPNVGAAVSLGIRLGR